MGKIPAKFLLHILIEEDENSKLLNAHCLELDVSASARSEKQLMDDISDVIISHLEFSDEHNLTPFKKAPSEYWEKLKTGRYKAVVVEEQNHQPEKEKSFFWKDHHHYTGQMIPATV
jgi:hypothetical protein